MLEAEFDRRRIRTSQLFVVACLAFSAWLLPSLAFAGFVSDSVQLFSPDETDPDTLVVCPHSLLDELAPWLEYRRSQGYRIAVVAPPKSAFELRSLIRQQAERGGLRNLVLVGSARGDHPLVPVDLRLAQVNFFFGSELDIATDNSYADTDQDGRPDLALGRIPVSTPDELRHYVQRVIRYENDQPQTSWRRRINVVAGVGGFGSVADKTIENTVKILLGDHIPPGYDVTMTYGSWTSPWCPDPRQFSKVALERFNEGCLFWVYVGHGSRQRLDLIRTPFGRFPVMDVPSTALAAPRAGNPIALFLACHTGAFDDPRTSLAETLLLREEGPIAVISGTRVTMPTAMGLLALGLLEQQFSSQTQTVGEMLRQAKLQLFQPSPQSVLLEVREMILGMNFLLSPRPDLLSQELNEHVHLFHLLGDPLVRVQRPEELKLAVEGAAFVAGGTVNLKGNAPKSGMLTVEVCYPRERLKQRPMARDNSKLTNEGLLSFQEEYERTINQTCLQERLQIAEGEFSHRLKLPPSATGELIVRVFLESEQGCAVGGVRINVSSDDILTRPSTDRPRERVGENGSTGRSK